MPLYFFFNLNEMENRISKNRFPARHSLQIISY